MCRGKEYVELYFHFPYIPSPRAAWQAQGQGLYSVKCLGSHERSIRTAVEEAARA